MDAGQGLGDRYTAAVREAWAAAYATLAAIMREAAARESEPPEGAGVAD